MVLGESAFDPIVSSLSGNCEQCPVLRLEFSWNLDFSLVLLSLLLLPLSLLLLLLLLHGAVNVMYPFRFDTPPLPKLAVLPHCIRSLQPPTPAESLVPARVDSEVHAESESRASPLRVPSPWLPY